MDVTIRAPLVHLCPYADEVDHGIVTIDYTPVGEPIELHGLAALLAEYHRLRLTHESVTQSLADRLAQFDPVVTTEFVTAGLTVNCRAVPRDCLHPEGT